MFHMQERQLSLSLLIKKSVHTAVSGFSVGHRIYFAVNIWKRSTGTETTNGLNQKLMFPFRIKRQAKNIFSRDVGSTVDVNFEIVSLGVPPASVPSSVRETLIDAYM